MSEYTVRLQSNQNNRTTLLGSVAPRKFGQLIDVNMIGVANGDLVSYDAATQTFVPVSNVSGITTYATASGVSTSVVGGIGSITQLYVSGISTLGIVKISSGIVTATSGVVTYYGDGSKLTGVNSFNVVTQTITNNPVYPTFVTATGVSSVAISTEQFVFIPSSGNLGIGTTNPTTTLHVQGNIGFGAGYNIKLGDSETGKSITSGTDNFFAGIGAGSSTSSGSENIFLGKWSGYCNTLGNENIFLGRGSGYYNTIGYNNIFFGTYAGRYNTEGVDNIFIGNSSGSSNIDGDFNNFFGTNSGYGNTSGIGNNFFGCSSGACNVSGNYNTFFGDQAGCSNTIGSNNVVIGNSRQTPIIDGSNQLAIGAGSTDWIVGNSSYNVGIGTTNPTTKLQINGTLSFGSDNNVKIGNNFTGCSITTGFSNFFVGDSAGKFTTSGFANIFFGPNAGVANTSGFYNNFLGSASGSYNTTGTFNNFIGSLAGYYNNSGSCNNFIGGAAGFYNSTSNSNVALGHVALYNNWTGSRNVSIGEYSASLNTVGNNNVYLAPYSGLSNTASRKVIIGSGSENPNLFDAPDPTKDTQLAIGVRIGANPTNYWIVGNENFNVGIGTTNPQYKLHVGGDVNFSGTLYQNGVAFSAGGGSSQWETVASGISTSSNVGIGTTNPTSKLDVIGDIVVSGNSTLGHIQISSGIITAVSGIVTYYGDGSNLTGVIATNGLVLTDVSADGLTFYAGKAAVGIATTEPFWSIRRTLFSGSGLVTSTGIARDISWINRNTGIYT